MKGGSVASDAVLKLVPADAFKQLDINFNNAVGGAKKAKKTSDKKTTKKGGMCPMCGGSSGKLMHHINEFDNSGITQLRNKRGGAAASTAAPLFDIKYDYGTSIMQSPHGAPIDRSLNFEVTKLMSSESPSVLGDFNKSIQYGNVTDVANTNFVYGGAKKSAPKKKTTNKTANKTTKKPSGKKAAKK